MKRHAFAVGMLSAVILASCTKEVQTEAPGYDDQSIAGNAAIPEEGQVPPGAYVPNELLVKFKKGVSATAREEALARAGVQVQERILTKAMEHFGDNEGLYLVRTPLEVMNAAAQFRVLGEVEYAEPNYIYTHEADITDKYFASGQLWGMNGAYGCQADKAWARGTTGSISVYVGVIDEGIQFDHPDLSGQVWTNPTDQTVDGTDQDESGVDGDLHGWDFDGNDNTIYDGGTRGSLDDHGTHVSGTIGAKQDGSGVVGVNWNVTLISGKFLGRRGGTTANAVKAVDYFTALRTKGNKLKVVATNNSWGGGGFSVALYDAISRANTAGILFVAAAGNGGSDGVGDNNDNTANFPSNYCKNNTYNGRVYTGLPNVIAVAAITSGGAKSSFSNYGATTVHLGAPGSSIISTTAYNGYSSYSGTSMATPHVTGAAALYASTHPTATAADIKAAIIGSVVATPSLKDITITGGRLNVSGF
jgi:subtilisin family serine protease